MVAANTWFEQCLPKGGVGWRTSGSWSDAGVTRFVRSEVHGLGLPSYRAPVMLESV